MRRRIYVHPVKINLDREAAEGLNAIHLDSGWQKNQIVRAGLRMFIAEYKRSGTGNAMAALRALVTVNPT